MILIHGSGPDSRHAELPGQLALQFGFAIPVFDELAAALPDADLTTETFAADARAAVDCLRTRSAVDPEAIVVAGHSQGSTFVPSLLAADPPLRGGIMLAAPYDSVDQEPADQAAFLSEIIGTAAGDNPAGAQTNEMAAQVAGLRSDAAATEAVLVASAAFWRAWMEAGDAAPSVLADVTQLVLLLFGGNDWNVPIDQAAKWRTATEGLDHVQLVAIECITHALNCLAESEPTKITPADIGRTVEPTVPASLIEFLDNS